MIEIITACLAEAKSRGVNPSSIFVDPKTYDKIALALFADKEWALKHFDKDVSDLIISSIPVFCDRKKEGGFFIQIEND